LAGIEGGVVSEVINLESRMSVNVLVFALGCGAAALLFMRFGVRRFVAPPLLAGFSLAARIAELADQ
jgi:hypothetical protein